MTKTKLVLLYNVVTQADDLVIIFNIVSILNSSNRIESFINNKKIESSMVEDITHLLPITIKDSRFPAYTNLQWKDMDHGYERVELDYGLEFERGKSPFFRDVSSATPAPGLPDAFVRFYRKRYGTEPTVREKSRQVFDNEVIIYDGDRQHVIMGLDTDKRYFYFIYQKSDKDIINFVDDFICMLIDS